MTDRVVARQDPALGARVIRSSALRYASGADPSLDRPGHVRAGSDLAWAGGRLVVVQDDANFVALVDPASASAVAIPLPAGAGGRRQFDDTLGNKADKLDLEAVASIPRPEGEPLVLALGSGSTPRRELVVTLRAPHERHGVGGAWAIALHPLPAFYARLRRAARFAGSELNVEAAVHVGDAGGGRLRLFNRGNGATLGGVHPVNATCDVSWSALAAHLLRPDDAPPGPLDIVRYDLGDVDGHAYTFTGAAVVQAPADAARRLTVYTAAAEASPDATRDGPVAGCAVGVIVEGADGIRARWAPLCDESGRPFLDKVEGIALRADDPGRAYVVVDRDVPEAPSELCEVALDGPWLTADS